jgi:V-type H+-transporting ATPase subunit a
MKLAVIFAILQMSLGIIMKGFNNIYFKQTVDFIFEFIPQLILLLALFGWMDALIIGKWLAHKNMDVFYAEGTPGYDEIRYSPPIITAMIDMFLSFGSNLDSDGNIKYSFVF